MNAPNLGLSATSNVCAGPRRFILGPWAPWYRWACPRAGCTWCMLQARPPAMVLDCGRLRWPWRCAHGGGGRLGTRVAWGGGGSKADTQPGHARAAGTQSSGWVCPLEPPRHPRNPRDQCKIANRPRPRHACNQPAADRSILHESMMSEENR